MESAGLYVHIPFCRRKCAYCAFYSVASADAGKIDRYREVLVSEARAYRSRYGCKIGIGTLYIGGGTPSLLPVPFYAELWARLQECFDFTHLREVTFEANPEHLEASYLHDLYRLTPVRRLSIGVQSFVDSDLKMLNRCHSGKDALDAIDRAREAGFRKLSIDLIYGLNTGQESSTWKRNLEILGTLDLDHFSAYSLTVEPGTTLWRKVSQGKQDDVSPDRQAAEYEELMDFAQKNGYEAYEISNFCRPGCEAVHNSHYWQDVPYIGLGASAHSYDGAVRTWNADRLDAYMDDPEGSRGREVLSEKDRYHEYVMTALRTVWGVSRRKIESFSEPIRKEFLRQAVRQMELGNLEEKEDAWVVRSDRRLLTDGIACEFF